MRAKYLAGDNVEYDAGKVVAFYDRCMSFTDQSYPAIFHPNGAEHFRSHTKRDEDFRFETFAYHFTLTHNVKFRKVKNLNGGPDYFELSDSKDPSFYVNGLGNNDSIWEKIEKHLTDLLADSDDESSEEDS